MFEKKTTSWMFSEGSPRLAPYTMWGFFASRCFRSPTSFLNIPSDSIVDNMQDMKDLCATWIWMYEVKCPKHSDT